MKNYNLKKVILSFPTYETQFALQLEYVTVENRRKRMENNKSQVENLI